MLNYLQEFEYKVVDEGIEEDKTEEIDELLFTLHTSLLDDSAVEGLNLPVVSAATGEGLVVLVDRVESTDLACAYVNWGLHHVPKDVLVTVGDRIRTLVEEVTQRCWQD